MSGKLSTHVLDTYHGCPACGVEWTLQFAAGAEGWTRLGSGVTNKDGRTDSPLLTGESLKTGSYRITFNVGAYFGGLGVELPEPAFLDEVVLQVSLIAGESYHVPLLTSPWSYSTYRGS
ncbi:MAG: hydroxyisourate hydrolase [Verrucomicrobiota bacterium]